MYGKRTEVCHVTDELIDAIQSVCNFISAIFPG